MHFAGYLAITNFSAYSEWIMRFRRRRLIQKLQETREVTDYHKKLVVMASLTYVMLLRPDHFSIYNLAKPQFHKEVFAMLQ
jgi:hypothetical protein